MSTPRALPPLPTSSTDSLNGVPVRKKRNIKSLQLPTPISPAPSAPLPSVPEGAAAGPVATRMAPGQPRRDLSIDIQNAQHHNTGLGHFGKGAVLGSGLPPISASVLMTPESGTTQRRNLQATLTTALENMRFSSRPEGGTTSGSGTIVNSGTLSTSGLKSSDSNVSSVSIASDSTAVSSTTTDGALTTANSYQSQAERDRDLIYSLGEGRPLRESDLSNIAELGMGNGGSVMKVKHTSSGVILAKKIVLIDAKPSVRKQILRELHIMHRASSNPSPYIVTSFGAFLSDSEACICICMEYMDKGSFEGIYKKIGDGVSMAGPIPIGIVRQVAKRVLGGLVYLYEEMGVLHRDIKPSNILLNSEGEVKLCDFGVSGELENSIAKTFVGTSTYMSPERIQGSDYSVKSDVWSLGITLIELAHGAFPFADSEVEFEPEVETPVDSASLSAIPSAIPSAQQRLAKRKSRGVSLHGGVQGGIATLSILELMHHIVREPPPTLINLNVEVSKDFAPEASEFVSKCLTKDPAERMNPRDLLGMEWMSDNFANSRGEEEMDLRSWAGTL
ncbi:hypothetical protein GYMLUDRAFT_36989 [Collybiopsis luxurians FD-317 M1]|nr:hypothetical protein GYMLUDRAFT_36989 [Collybiopsis luxurians FD-317 M1]